jgi:hypothetical protein
MQSTSLAGRSILVVEDEPLIALDSTAFSHELARARRTPGGGAGAKRLWPSSHRAADIERLDATVWLTFESEGVTWTLDAAAADVLAAANAE